MPGVRNEQLEDFRLVVAGCNPVGVVATNILKQWISTIGEQEGHDRDRALERRTNYWG